MTYIYLKNTSTVTFRANDVRLGSGLSLTGNHVSETGILSGTWFDGTSWSVDIAENAFGAKATAIPEPATPSVLALGCLARLRRRKQGR